MTRDEISLLAQRPGISLGGHSVHHLQLVKHDKAIQTEEVKRNKEALDALLNQSVDGFAYPYGEHSEPLERVVADCGYRFAVTVAAAPVTRRSALMRLPRYEVKARTPRDFLAAVETLLEGAT